MCPVTTGSEHVAFALTIADPLLAVYCPTVGSHSVPPVVELVPIGIPPTVNVIWHPSPATDARVHALKSYITPGHVVTICWISELE